MVENLVNKVISARAKSEGASKVAGKKRQQYSAAFKTEAINVYDNGANQESITESFGLTQSQISRWLKKWKTIPEDAASSHRRLYLKGRRSTKYVELYETLFKEVLAARSRWHVVNFSWSRARKLQLDIDPKFEVKHHVIVLFLQKKELRMRSRQRNKRKHKKEMEPSLKKRHATFREKCIGTGWEHPRYDQK